MVFVFCCEGWHRLWWFDDIYEVNGGYGLSELGGVLLEQNMVFKLRPLIKHLNSMF